MRVVGLFEVRKWTMEILILVLHERFLTEHPGSVRVFGSVLEVGLRGVYELIVVEWRRVGLAVHSDFSLRNHVDGSIRASVGVADRGLAKIVGELVLLSEGIFTLDHT